MEDTEHTGGSLDDPVIEDGKFDAIKDMRTRKDFLPYNSHDPRGEEDEQLNRIHLSRTLQKDQRLSEILEKQITGKRLSALERQRKRRTIKNLKKK